jgi:integrase
MRTRTKGIQAASDGSKVVNKQYRGRRIFERLGRVSQEEAEIWLRKQQDRIDGEIEIEGNPRRLFCDAAKKYLLECERKKVRSLDVIIYHVSLLLPYVGTKPLEIVHSGSFESFIEDRMEDDKVSPTTINRTLEVARTILNRAARVWRGEDGKAWLGAAPMIEMMDENRRQPYPISWEEQRQLFAQLPPHIERPALFAINTGARDDNVCGLRWQWERRIPELGRSVFVIPAEEYKGKRPHVLILNDVAMSVVESCRGKHQDYVFTYSDAARGLEPYRMDTMNNTAYQNARKRAKLTQVRIHDFRHTFAQRLRDAGVAEEDRAVLLGHATDSMPKHYATPTVARLVELANRVQQTRDATTLLRVVNA